MRQRTSLLGPRETADRLGVTPSRLAALRREHRIRPVYTGARITLYRASDVARLVAERNAGRPG